MTISTDTNILELRLEDFGGSADGITDNMQAVKSVIDKLQLHHGPKKILFGEGSYRFIPDNSSHAIIITGVSDLEIIGQGPDKTNIIIGNSHSGFLNITHSRNISTKGLSVDHDPLPFTQGTIVSVNPDELTYDLKIDEGFGVPTEDWFTAEADVYYAYRTSHIMDSTTGGFKANTPSNVFVDKETTDLGNRVYRFKSSTSGFLAGLGKEAWHKGQLETGDRMVVLSRACGAHNLFYGSCENTLYEDIAVYSSTGFAVMNENTSGTVIVRNISIRKKDNRIISLCCDGINFNSCRGRPLVENCYIEANCDDSISGQAGAPTISLVENPRKLFIQNVVFSTPMKGDRAAVFSQRSGKMLGETKILEISEKNIEGLGPGFWVILEDPVEGMVADSNPAYADLLMIPDCINSGITIRDCTIAIKAGRGIYLHSQDMLIENCIFKDVGGQALMLANEGPCRTNGYVRNVTIRNNTFINSAFCEKVWDMWAPIHIGTLRGYYPEKGDTTMYISASEPISDNISITGNTFKNSAGSYIFLSAVRDASIEGNLFETAKDYPTLENDALIIAENCNGIKIERNTFSDFRDGLGAIVEARGNTPRDGISISLENNTFHHTATAVYLK